MFLRDQLTLPELIEKLSVIDVRAYVFRDIN